MLTVSTISIAALFVACALADVDDVEQATTTYPKVWLSRYLYTEPGCVGNTDYEIFVRVFVYIIQERLTSHNRRRNRLTPVSNTCPTTPPTRSLTSTRATIRLLAHTSSRTIQRKRFVFRHLTQTGVCRCIYTDTKCAVAEQCRDITTACAKVELGNGNTAYVTTTVGRSCNIASEVDSTILSTVCSGAPTTLGKPSMFGLWKYNLYGGAMCNSDGIVMDESFELSVRLSYQATLFTCLLITNESSASRLVNASSSPCFTSGTTCRLATARISMPNAKMR
jgi:hypothetical protein